MHVLRDFPGNLKIALADAPSFQDAITQQMGIAGRRNHNSSIAKTVVVRILIDKIPRVSVRRIVVKVVGGVLEVD